MDLRLASRIISNALIVGFIGVGFALAGWVFAQDKIIEVIITRGDMLLSLSIVGSAFVILGALTYISLQITELLNLLRK